MKILHAADLHLASKMDAHLPKDLADVRRIEVRKSFQNMINYANAHSIQTILLAGDIFDSDLPLKHDKTFFYQLLAENSHITFYYLRGNHDCKTNYTEQLENVKTFTDSWQYYTLSTQNNGKDIIIAGIEQTEQNSTNLYHHLNLMQNTINIVLLHGQESRTQYGKDIVNITALQNKNIDYLALGHIHKYTYKRLDSRGHYAYSGCLEGRGFDELGPKGFIELTIENGKINHKFVATSQREILEITIDITDCNSFANALTKIKKEVQLNQQNIYKLILIGAVSFTTTTLAEIVKNHFSTNCFFIAVQDKTTTKQNITEIQKENSLRGEFVRTVLQAKEWNAECKEKIITLGLKALSNTELQ